MAEDFFIRDGLIWHAGRPLSGREVYDYFSKNKHTSESEARQLIFSRRPATFTYEVLITDHAFFDVYYKKHKLTGIQKKNAADAGYFIENNQVFFLNSTMQAEISSTASGLTSAKLLKLSRQFRREKKLKNTYPNLTEELANLPSAVKPENSSLFVKELYPYQKTGLDWLVFCANNSLGTILADDMGLGKTAQVIALICDTLQREPSSKILVVVPNPLLENWKREFAFFSPLLNPYLHYGTNRTGLTTDLEEHNIIITPYTTLTSDISIFVDIEFKLVFFDEASMLKNPTSARSKSASDLNGMAKIAMTGTPVENSLTDAWALSNIVFPGYLGDLNSFKKQYVSRDIKEVLDKNLEELEYSLRQITLRRMKRDVLKDLPVKQDIHIPIRMLESEKALHDRIISDMKSEAAEGAKNILPMIIKLQQFTSHPSLVLEQTGDNTIKDLVSRSNKFDLLVSHLDQITVAKEKVIIFVTFTKMIDTIFTAIMERYGIAAGIIDGRTPNDDRQAVIDKFSNHVGFDALILHPKTAGMGLNITAATHVIHYSRQWNPALEEQATARAWRNGQTKYVSVYYFYYIDSIEEVIDERLKLKQDLSDRVVSLTDDKESDKKLMLDYLENYIQ